MNRKGITLLELVIVMIIIALGAVLMVPSIGAWLPHYRLRSAARDIVSSMRSAQMKAVASNVEYRVSFDTTNNSFQILRQITTADSDPQPLPTGISFDSLTFPVDGTTGKPTAVFNPNSTASGGNVILRNPKHDQKTITVAPTTGKVGIQ